MDRDRTGGWLIGLVVLAALACPAMAIEATGDGSNLWVVKPTSDKQIVILHGHHVADEPTLYRAQMLNGRLAQYGVASTHNQLWLVYDNFIVQSIRAILPTEPAIWQFKRRSEPSLPKGVKLLGLAVGRHGTWALVRVEDSGTLESIDIPAPAPASVPLLDALDNAKGDLPGLSPVLDGDPEVKHLDPQALATVKRGVPAADRLLRLSGHGWAKVPLPPDWHHGAPARIVMGRPTSTKPLLVSALAEAGSRALRVYHPTETGWDRYHHTLDEGHFQIAAIGQRLVVAQQLNRENQLGVRLLLVRPELLQELGVVEFGDIVGPSWALVHIEGPSPVGVLAWTGNTIRLRQINWEGVGTPPQGTTATRLYERVRRPWSGSISQLVLLVVLSIATVIMFVFWRRDPNWNRLELPGQIALADLSRRGIASIIDLAPSFVLIFLIYGMTPAQLLHHHWPGRSNQVDQMVPGAIAIGLYLTITFICELFTGRTFGKKLFGLRVTTLTGERPNRWQVLIRNVMKCFELTAWFLLILPAIVPSRQRLGDIVARTVVVSNVASSSHGEGAKQ